MRHTFELNPLRALSQVVRTTSVLLVTAAAIAPGAAHAACLGDPAWFPLGPAAAVASAGPALGVAASGSLLQLIDVTEPAEPRLLASLSVGASITSVAAIGDDLWVTTAAPSLLRIAGAGPTVASTTPLPAYPYHVTATATAVVVALDGGVLVYPTADDGPPGLPTLIAAEAGTYPGGVAVSGDRLVVAANQRSALEVWSLADPSAPALLGSLTPEPALFMGEVRAAGDLVAVSTFGIDLYDVSDPAAPRYLGVAANWIEDTPIAFDLVADDLVVITWRSEELRVIDVSDPATPRTTTRLTGFADSRAVARAGNTVFVAAGAGGVTVLDLAAGARATLPAFGSSLSIALDGAMAAVGDDAGNVAILHVPPWAEALELVGSLFVAGTPVEPSAERVAVGLAGDRLVAAHADAVTVVDITDPAAPQVVVSLPGDGGWPAGVALRDALAHVAGWRELTLVDLADPSGAAVVGSVDHQVPIPLGLALGPGWVAVAGLTAPSASASGRLVLIATADPTTPTVMATIGLTAAFGVAVADTTVYVAAGDGGLVAVDASQPSAPHILATIAVPDTVPAAGVWVDGTTIWVAGGYGTTCPLRRLRRDGAATLVDLGCAAAFPVEDMAFSAGRAALATGVAGSAVAERVCRVAEVVPSAAEAR